MQVIPEERETVFVRGRPVDKVVSKGVIVRFSPGGVTDNEYEQSLKVWKGPHGVTSDADPRQYYSIFDTDIIGRYAKWDEETKEEVERVLVERQGSDYFKLEEPRPSRPWPTYDEMDDPEKIVWVAETTGVLKEALAYEKDTLARTDVIEALEGVGRVA